MWADLMPQLVWHWGQRSGGFCRRWRISPIPPGLGDRAGVSSLGICTQVPLVWESPFPEIHSLVGRGWGRGESLPDSWFCPGCWGGREAKGSRSPHPSVPSRANGHQNLSCWLSQAASNDWDNRCYLFFKEKRYLGMREHHFVIHSLNERSS